jgi:hypothetical protein
MGYSSETIIKVHDDETGEYVYVGPDADSLDFVELRAVDSDGKIYPGARITMPPVQAILVAKAILKLYGDK